MQPKKLPGRVWVETAMAALSAAATLLTLAWPQWIEGLFDMEPDAGSGETEWGISIGLAVATLAFVTRAAWAWRRHRRQALATRAL